jgi:uncharacterized protein YceH (UPF0502 family)
VVGSASPLADAVDTFIRREDAERFKRYSHLLDGRITEAAARFDPARTP